MSEMTDPDDAHAVPSMARAGLLLGSGAALMLVAAGGLLWWREGEKLFTDGLVAAIMRCF